VWPQAANGSVSLTPAQLSMLLEALIGDDLSALGDPNAQHDCVHCAHVARKKYREFSSQNRDSCPTIYA